MNMKERIIALAIAGLATWTVAGFFIAIYFMEKSLAIEKCFEKVLGVEGK